MPHKFLNTTDDYKQSNFQI